MNLGVRLLCRLSIGLAVDRNRVEGVRRHRRGEVVVRAVKELEQEQRVQRTRDAKNLS